jgi:hypothetical protein
MVEALGTNKKNGCALILIIYPTEKPLFTRLSENNGDRLYFLSCTKCGRTKEDCPHYFSPSGVPF